MKKYIYNIAIACSLLIFTGCSTESEVSFLELSEDLGFEFDGSEDAFIEVLSQDSYNTLVNLGIDINTGDNPPNITGSFICSPQILAQSNISNEPFEIGHQFNDDEINFSNQSDLSISYFGPGESSVNSLISGSGNSFTVIAEIVATLDGSSGSVTLEQGVIFSGTITQDGIVSYERAFVILDKSGDVDDEFIDVGEGRRVVDGDGLASRQ